LCTDPPYYNNIGYADLSDFFYVWLRRSIGGIYPNLFRTLLTPKSQELVASPYRFNGDREKARNFFESGLGKATAHMRAAQSPDYPMTMIYAYKQAETEVDADGNGVTASTGWETMLTGIVNAGFSITGTWPMRTESAGRAIARNTNALASSIVLACRPRPDDAPVATRRDFAVALRRELPSAVRGLQQENIAPVDLAQAAIGPGMAVFSHFAKVLEADGSSMSVRTALIEINRVLDETLAEQEGDMDSDTRFCVAWFEQYGLKERAYGEAEVLLTAKNTSFDGLQRASVIVGGNGKVRLKRRDEMHPVWDPRTDPRLTDWECVQRLVRAMTAEQGGGVAEAARLVAAMGPGRAENARALAYRLYTVSERKGWTDEALAYNILVTSWTQIQVDAVKLASGGPAQAQLAL
jgi:putative DNA methylase